jgi:hypothetical protein
VLQDLRPWVAKAPQVSKTGSVLADAGIDTSVLPEEQPPVHAEPEGQDQRSTATADTTEILDDSHELVSWHEAQEHLEHERSEGVPSEEPVSVSAAPSEIPGPEDVETRAGWSAPQQN